MSVSGVLEGSGQCSMHRTYEGARQVDSLLCLTPLHATAVLGSDLGRLAEQVNPPRGNLLAGMCRAARGWGGGTVMWEEELIDCLQLQVPLG